MLYTVSDDAMEGIDLVPLRIDLAPLLFELDKQLSAMMLRVCSLDVSGK
jgi:hypothetical protein